jgi:MATE family multidrug resistance protein
MVVLLLCIGANAALNWVLIFGHLGAPALGITGSGYASAINQWLMVGGLALYVRLTPSLAALRLLRGAWAGAGAAMAAIVRLGLPIGGIFALEAGVFVTAGVVMGLLGADALAANQIILNCASVTFMVPYGIGQAATVRVAFERGAGRWEAARRAGWTALGLGVGFMGLAAVVFWLAPRTIVGAYIALDDPANHGVAAIAVRLLAIAALFQVVDGAQAIAAGALRGYEDTTVPMFLAALGYWVIGFAGGWLLAFPLGLGAVGLWWGLALGLAVVALLLTVRLYRLEPEKRKGRIAAAPKV